MGRFVKVKEWIIKHKKLCVFIVVILVMAISINSCISRVRTEQEKRMAEMNKVQTATVERRTLVSSISATGTVASAESKNVAVNLTGREIKAMSVEVGDTVEEGSILCEFDSEDIEQSLADAKAALAVSSGKTELDLTSAQRNLAEAQKSSEIQKERMDKDVADAWQDYLLAVTDMEEAEDEWEKAKNTTSEKTGEYERVKKEIEKVKNAGVSENDLTLTQLKKELEEWKMKESTAKQEESGAEAAYEQAKAAADSKLESYESKVRSQEDSLRNNESSIASKTDSLTSSQLSATTSTTQDKQKVEEYEEQLENCILKSPISGVITAISAQEGDTYTGGTLFTIEDISSYEVSAEIDEYDIGKVKEGQTVAIKTNGTGDMELEGTVQSIAPRATSVSAASGTSSNVTYNVRISIDTPSDLLKLDMTAKLSIVLSSKENVLSVPYEAVQEDENGRFYVEAVEERSEPKMDETGSATDKAQEGEIAGEKEAGQEEKKGQIPQEGGEGTPDLITRRIYVEKGIESDYYIQVISKEITEGMQIVVPKSEGEGMDINSMMMNRGPMGGF